MIYFFICVLGLAFVFAVFLDLWFFPSSRSVDVIHAVRTQSDDLGDQYSADSACGFDGDDLCRQEFLADSLTSTLMARYAGAPPVRTPSSGDVDFDADLQTHLMAAARSKAAFDGLPADVRGKARDWMDIEQALFSGALIVKDGRFAVPAPPVPAAVVSDPHLAL